MIGDGLPGYCRALHELMERAGYEGDSMHALLADFAEEKRWSAHEREYGAMGNCFGNAANTALWVDGLHYVEGLAVPGDIPLPVEHAWCEDDAGRVIDVTWRPEGRATEKMRYLGVRVPDELLRETLIRRKVYGVLEDRLTVERLRELLGREEAA